MATKTEEIRLKFSSDTKEIKTAGRDFRAFTNDMLQGERRVKSNLTQLAGSFASASSGAELVSGGIDHLASTLKLGMGTLVGIAVATKAFSAITDIAKERADSFNKTMESVNGSAISGQYTTAASGVEALTEELAKQEKTRTQAEETLAMVNDDTGFKLSDLITKAKNIGFSALSPVSSGDLKNQAQDAEDKAQLNTISLRGKIIEAMQKENEIAKMKLTGDVRGAQFATIELEKKKKLEKIETDGLGIMAERTKEVTKGYDMQVRALKVENELTDRLLEKQGLIGDIENSNLSVKQKALRIKREEVGADVLRLQAMNAKGETAENSPAAAALAEKIRVEGNAGRKGEVQNFGTQLSMQRMITARKRADRRFNRKQERFDRSGGLMNVHRDINGNVTSGIDPLTGKSVTREAHSALDDFMGGKTSRILGKRPLGVTSGLNAASMLGNDEFSKHFHPENVKENVNAGPDVKLLEEMNSYLKIIANKEGIQ